MSTPTADSPKKVTTRTLIKKKRDGQPITMLTGYDYATAVALDKAGIDAILVGDSLGMVVLGHPTTLPVTMDDMISHCQAVSRGASTPLLIGDMPFMSFQVTVEDAVRNAGRFLKEAGMDAVKLEGGRDRAAAVRAIVSTGIPVMGHLGLTPQSVHQMGGFRAQAKSVEAAKNLIDDALALQEAGAFSIVLESIPARLAQLVSERLSIPTIGIGAGVGCDGQVLVTHDMLGLFDRFTPRFVKTYADIHGEMARAFAEYIQDVESRAFPAQEHSVDISEDVWSGLMDLLESPDRDSDAA